MATSVFRTKAAQRQIFQRYRAGVSWRVIVWWGFWLALFAIGLLLSQWQWQRAQEKKAIQQAEQRAVSLFNPVTQPPALAQVTISGVFEEQHSLWLDNRILAGQVGVALLTPLIDVNGRWWLVDRGFVATAGSRKNPPFPPLEDIDLQVVTAVWQPLENKDVAFVLDDALHNQRIQTLDLKFWPRASDGFAGVLHLQADSQGLGARQVWWQPMQISVERHLGYSLQWMLLAFLALGFAVAGRKAMTTAARE